MLDKNKKIIVGLMPGSIDTLIAASGYKGDKIIFKYLIPRHKEEAVWAKRILPKSSLVFYDLNDIKSSLATLDLAGLVKKSNITKKIKEAGISHLLSGHAATNNFYKWIKNNQLELIAPDFKLVKNLENKLWFDNFLLKNNLPKPASQIWTSRNQKNFLTGRLVLQNPNSRGGEGTYFINNFSDIKRLIKVDKIKKSKQYLLRQFITGQSYGLTIFVGQDIVALSALRKQCYGQKNKIGQREFLGIQWINSHFFSKKLQVEINRVFYNLAENLRKIGYRGYANIDFIVSGRQIYILECNPRFSASSAQLILFSESISKINTANLYFKDLLWPTNKMDRSHFFGLPLSNFSGATLYFASHGSKKGIKNYYPAGVYRVVNGKIKFITPDIRKLKAKDKSFIFYSDTQPGEILSAGVIVGSVISSFPLYDRSGQINYYGKIITEYFRY